MVTIEFLKKVAGEMNDVMGLEPEIDLEDEGKLEAVIRNESKEIDLKEDEGKFSEGVEDYFKVEELWPVTKVEAKTETKPETKKEETVSKKKGKAKSKAKKKKVASKKKSAGKKEAVAAKKTTSNSGKNQWGIRKGTKADKVCVLFAAGKYTMADVIKKVGNQQYGLARQLNVKKTKDGILKLS